MAFKKGSYKKPEIGKGVDCYGGVDTNDNPNEFKGFKPNDGAVNQYGGVSSNENPYEYGKKKGK